MSANYGSWSLADLKSELKKRNAKTTGKKAVLVQRLEDYDRLFGPLINDTESVFKIVLPKPECFRDVTSESPMPVLTNSSLETFCELTGREDIETSNNMYKENFLLTCRTAHHNNEYFITGVCASEMRKNVYYNVTVKVKDHMILETQCECAAGAGPYGQCKHIMVIIYAIIDYSETKSIKLKTSCTSSLQTFHHPKINYTGNPIEAEKLKLKFKKSTLNAVTNFDPRPAVESAEKYREKFRNLIANASHAHPNMAISEHIMPADKRSIYKDHDYLKKTAEEQYLDSLVLEEKELVDLEEKTRNNKKIWLKERVVRLQSSDFGVICKQKTNKNRLAQSLIKVSNIESPAIKHGRKYEAEAIQTFEKITSLPTRKVGINVHPEFQFLGSTPDALVGNNEILEVKCPYSARNEKISVENVPYLYLCEKTGLLKLDKKHNYYYQIQGQLFCCRRNCANFFIYTIKDYYLVKIERNEEFLNEMVKNLKSFYDTYYRKVLLSRFLYNERI